MTKPRRADAGREVVRLADAFSARLLAEEEACFARIDREFRRPVSALQADLRARLAAVDGSVARLRSDLRLRELLVANARSAAEACGAHVMALGATAARMAFDSIQAELTWCERTLPAAYQGLAEEATSQARTAMDHTLGGAATEWAATATGAVSRFADQVVIQIAAEEEPDRLMKRLFSETPAGLRGFGGRGVWWRTPSSLKDSARWVSIQTANRCRNSAMQAFNDRGAVRG